MGGSEGIDVATIREFLAEKRALSDAATKGPWHAIETEEIESAHDDDLIAYIARMAPRTPSRPPFPLEIVLQANASAHGEPFLELSKEDAAFIADARESLPQALDLIKELLAERERDAPAIRAAVRLAATVIRQFPNLMDFHIETFCTRNGILHITEDGDGIEPTDLGRAVCALAERMEADDAG